VGKVDNFLRSYRQRPASTAETDPDLRRDGDIEEVINHVYEAAGSIDDTP
jgi:hypothetical protein